MRNEWVDQYLEVIQLLENEIDAYQSEDQIFEILPGTNNSGGNLIMHLIGNLRHFYGAILLQDGTQRNRDFEFNGRMSISEMKEQVLLLKGMIQVYFAKQSDDVFTENYPSEFAGHTVTNGFMFLKLLQHFTYHLGQINYHRRALQRH